MLITLDPQDVTTYERDLDTLSADCQETRDRLAGMPAVVHREMAKKGVDESDTSIIDQVAAIVTKTGAQSSAALPMKCADIFAAYATLRMDDFSQ